MECLIMNEELQNILYLDWCEERIEKSKYFTEEFFEKHSTKYRDLIEKYDELALNNDTMYNMKNEEYYNFFIHGLDFENIKIEKYYNFLLNLQEEAIEFIQREKENLIIAIEKLELKDDLSWKISFDISVIKKEILKELKEIEKEYGEVILDELEDLRAKKILLLVNLMELEELKFNLNPFKYIPIYKNLNYFMILINKDNGKIYKLDGIYDFDLEFIEIAENFDEFMERLYLGDPIDFEDDNDYEEILRKIEESTGKKE